MPRSLRVMVDARMLIGRFAGVSRFVTRLVDELAKQDRLEVVVLYGRAALPARAGRRGIEVIRSDFGPGDRTATRRLAWEETRLPALIRRSRVDLFHATWNTGVPARCPVPAVLTIHDLIPWHDPKTHFATALQRACHRYAVRASTWRASRITTVSNYVRRQVLSELPLHPEGVVTIPNGVDRANADISTLRRFDVSPFVLYVGGHEPRKNLGAVFAAMQRYWERFDPTLQLRITGHATSLSQDAAQAYRGILDNTRAAGFSLREPSQRVHFLGDITDTELTRQYASAQLLLMLSLDEGFGLPVLEAMAHGCPVVAANKAALPEVTGDAGTLVDPGNTDGVAEAMRMIITMPDRRAELIRQGKSRAATFGWDVAAARMREVYERVVHEAGRSLRRTSHHVRDGH